MVFYVISVLGMGIGFMLNQDWLLKAKCPPKWCPFFEIVMSQNELTTLCTLYTEIWTIEGDQKRIPHMGSNKKQGLKAILKLFLTSLCYFSRTFVLSIWAWLLRWGSCSELLRLKPWKTCASWRRKTRKRVVTWPFGPRFFKPLVENYRGDLNTGHLNNANIWIRDLLAYHSDAQ